MPSLTHAILKALRFQLAKWYLRTGLLLFTTLVLLTLITTFAGTLFSGDSRELYSRLAYVTRISLFYTVLILLASLISSQYFKLVNSTPMCTTSNVARSLYNAVLVSSVPLALVWILDTCFSIFVMSNNSASFSGFIPFIWWLAVFSSSRTKLLISSLWLIALFLAFYRFRWVVWVWLTGSQYIPMLFSVFVLLWSLYISNATGVYSRFPLEYSNLSMHFGWYIGLGMALAFVITQKSHNKVFIVVFIVLVTFSGLLDYFGNTIPLVRLDRTSSTALFVLGVLREINWFFSMPLVEYQVREQYSFITAMKVSGALVINVPVEREVIVDSKMAFVVPVINLIYTLGHLVLIYGILFRSKTNNQGN